MSKTKRGSKRSFNKKQRRRRTKYLKNKKGRLYGGLKIGKANVDHTAFKVNDFVKELDILNSFYQGIVTEPNSDIPLKYSVIAQIVANTLKSNKLDKFNETNIADYHPVWRLINQKVGSNLKLKIPCYVELVEAYFINNTPNIPFLEFLNGLVANKTYDDLIAGLIANYKANINIDVVKNLLGQLYESDHTPNENDCIVDQYIKANCNISLYRFAVGKEDCTEKIVNKFPVQVVHETKEILEKEVQKILEQKAEREKKIEIIKNQLRDRIESSSNSPEIEPQTDWNPFYEKASKFTSQSEKIQTDINAARKKEQEAIKSNAAGLQALKSVIPEKKESEAEKKEREVIERQAEINKLNLTLIKESDVKENNIEKEKNELMTQALSNFYKKNVEANFENQNNYLDYLKTLNENGLFKANFDKNWKINRLVTLLETHAGIKGGTRRKNKKKKNKSKYKRTRRAY
jgi:hypothetical protein